MSSIVNFFSGSPSGSGAIQDMFKSDAAGVDYLQSQLDMKMKEISMLREELKVRDKERSQLLNSQQQYHDIVEAQEAELERVRQNQSGGSNAVYWETRCEKAVVALQEEKDREATLTQFITEAKEQIGIQEKDLGRMRRRSRMHANRPDSDSETEDAGEQMKYRRRDGVQGYKRRLDKMISGQAVNVWQKEKFVNTFISLSADARQLRLAVNQKKQPFAIIDIKNIASVEYPARITTKKKKANDLGKPYMKFSICPDNQPPIHILAPNDEALDTWYIGLQNLSASPAQGPVSLGGFLWTKTRAKLSCEAVARNTTAHRLLVDVFTQMLPETETILAEVAEADGGQSARSQKSQTNGEGAEESENIAE